MTKVTKFIFLSFLAVVFLSGAVVAQAATNPFMDVPMNHWAYDAVSQLAGRGILSGYPDGLYKGKQAMTRYEVASAVARAIGYIDMQKADKQDVELLKRLVVEFKDELDALGVRVDNLETDMGVFKERLGGWKISGSMHLDARLLNTDDWGIYNTIDLDYTKRMQLSRARLNLSRRFGENEDMLFFAQLDSFPNRRNGEGIEFSKFYVTMPLNGDFQFTAGRFGGLSLSDMFFSAGRFGNWSNGAWFGDINRDGLGIKKNFAIGEAGVNVFGRDNRTNFDNSVTIASYLTVRPTEQLEATIGVDYKSYKDDVNFADYERTVMAYIAPKFHFNDSVSLKGAFYAQFNSHLLNPFALEENPKAWKAILDIKQDVLKFTSLWLEYDRLDKGFILLRGARAFYLEDNDYRDFFQSTILGSNVNIFRIGANQQWNEKWSTWLYYSKINYDETLGFGNEHEYSAGIEYKLNANAHLGLGYFHSAWDTPINGVDTLKTLNFRVSVFF